jgi:hypothetical protein
MIERDYMARLDDRAARALRILIDQDQSKLTEEVRSDWARFLIACELRAPRAVDNVISTFKSVLRENLSQDDELRESLKDKTSLDPYDWLEQTNKHVAADKAKLALISCIESQDVGNIVINMRWSVVPLRDSSHDILTSDCPQLRANGLKERNCVIALPLNPNLLFVATHGRSVMRRLSTSEQTAMVKWVNDNIVRAADRYVFGRTDDHLRFVENRLRRPGR